MRAKGIHRAQRGRTILDAIGVLERALALAPDDPNVHAALGNAWRVKEQYGLGTREECSPRAYEHLHRALALDPNHAEALGHLGAIITSEGGLPQTHRKALHSSSAPSRSIRASRSVRAHSCGGWGMAIARETRDDARAIREVQREPRGRPAQSDLSPPCTPSSWVSSAHVAEAVEEGRSRVRREPGVARTTLLTRLGAHVGA